MNIPYHIDISNMNMIMIIPDLCECWTASLQYVVRYGVLITVDSSCMVCVHVVVC